MTIPAEGVAANTASRMPTADEIFGRRPAAELWPGTQPVLAIALEMLPTIEDDLIADLVEHLARAIVDLEEELRAVRAVSAASFELLHEQHLEIARRQKRLADLLDARQRERTNDTTAAGGHRTAHVGRTAQHKQGSTEQVSAEEKSLYGKGRVGIHSAAEYRTDSTGQRTQGSTGTHRTGGPWT